jgi:hypothetical protein
MTRKGFFKEPERHALGAKGIKTNNQKTVKNNFVARGYYSDKHNQLEEKFNKLIEAMAEKIQAVVGDDSVMNYQQALNVAHELARSGELDAISQFGNKAEDTFREIMTNQELEDYAKPGKFITYEDETGNIRKWQITGVTKNGSVILGRKGKKDESVVLSAEEFRSYLFD